MCGLKAHFLNPNQIRLLSIFSSLALVPAAIIFGEKWFWTLCALNFVLFHAIWISRYFKSKPAKFGDTFNGMRIPLVLFALCGNAGWMLLAGGGELSFPV